MKNNKSDLIKKIHFYSTTENNDYSPLISEWKRTLISPLDDMWASFINQSNYWEILFKHEILGYACVNSKNQLLQFYLQPEWLGCGPEILDQFIINQKLTKAIIGTNNPIALSCAMHHQKKISIHSYLFALINDGPESQSPDNLTTSSIKDLDRLVNFYHNSTDGSIEWLNGYLSNLINRSESYYLEENDEIVGTCEVRLSDEDREIANIGMVVSPDHRMKGFGTLLLKNAKNRALKLNRKPICSCEKTNIGSLKAIHKNGFRSMHQMLLIEFE